MIKYKRFKFKNRSYVDQLSRLFLDIANEKYSLNAKVASLSDIHDIIDEDNINNFRKECFTALNNTDWKADIAEQALKSFQHILGQDLLIQKKINLSIQMLEDASSILPAIQIVKVEIQPFSL